ncbi:MAG: hypothetical protein WBY94_02445 [Polyangiaceae bacterium]
MVKTRSSSVRVPPEELTADVLAEIRLEPKSRNPSSKMLFDGRGERCHAADKRTSRIGSATGW